MNFYDGLQILSVVVALTGCGQAPSSSEVATATNDGINNPDAPLVVPGDDNAPAPVTTPPDPGSTITTITYTMGNRRLCIAIRDLDPTTTALKVVPNTMDYYYTFADPITSTLTLAGQPEQPQGPVGYDVLIFTNQQVVHAGDPTRCRITINVGQVTNFETTGF